MTPKVQLEEWQARRAALVEQLRQMENHLADPQRSPSFGTHTNLQSDTEKSIARAKEQIAELDDLIANIGMPRA